ncbi:ADP-ribosylglycohydrolase family protein [Oceanivirga miroungae]|uniref:ADP-ribosylglycohydrolase n=1 Tax=Oceanivirga miroungae TaxID=1130046 RepID=A0A6I8MAR5_9FUSO|nr:ADP-ribosylglycohydrolase family protein [Oceanivirga miroungae]VWL85273.1 hypothetical protein OMES3154_00556 [Oceanivirga miroungae]
MVGAVIGDIVGSRFEFKNNKSKEFLLFTEQNKFTDDSLLTIAIANAFNISKTDFSDLEKNTINSIQTLARKYNNLGYGFSFYNWVFSSDPKPYNSFANGGSMRVSSVAYAAKNLEEVKKLTKIVTEITHNHIEAIKGATCVAEVIYLARTGKKIKEIKEYVEKNYYELNFTLDEIRPTYLFDLSTKNTVPVALEAFFESNSFEDAIRNAISVGGDSDTIAAITGSISEAYYKVPEDIREKALSYLPKELLDILVEFENKYE